MTESYLQRQKDAKDSRSVAKISLLNFRSHFPSGNIVVVEGVDDIAVYSQWISRANPYFEYEFLELGGKRNIRQLWNSLGDDLGRLREGMFSIVDHDFDGLEGFEFSEGVFLLERYSFENYLVSAETLQSLLKSSFPCAGKIKEREDILSVFDKDYDSYCFAVKDLNREMFIARKSKINIDGKIPKSIDFAVDIKIVNVVRMEYAIEDHLSFEKPDDAIVASIIQKFNEINPLTGYRGKYALKFFSKWLDMLCLEYEKPSLSLFSATLETHGKVRRNDFHIGSLASRSPLPENFVEFFSC